jgi:hypothetical protein
MHTLSFYFWVLPKLMTKNTGSKTLGMPEYEDYSEFGNGSRQNLDIIKET